MVEPSNAFSSASSGSAPGSSHDGGPFIRRAQATKADAEAITAVARPVFRATFEKDVGERTMTTYLETHLTVESTLAGLANPDQTFFLAIAPPQPSDRPTKGSTADTGEQAEGTCVGFAALIERTQEECVDPLVYPKPVELRRIYVSTAHHGLGAGRHLMDTAVAWARERGYESMWLGVYPTNLRAKGFYTKMGFVRIGKHPFIFADEVQEDEIMARRL